MLKSFKKLCLFYMAAYLKKQHFKRDEVFERCISEHEL